MPNSSLQSYTLEQLTHSAESPSYLILIQLYAHEGPREMLQVEVMCVMRHGTSCRRRGVEAIQVRLGQGTHLFGGLLPGMCARLFDTCLAPDASWRPTARQRGRQAPSTGASTTTRPQKRGASNISTLLTPARTMPDRMVKVPCNQSP